MAKRIKRPRSQAEAGWLGRIAGGDAKSSHLTRAGAKTMLRGVDVSKLPKRKGDKP